MREHLADGGLARWLFFVEPDPRPDSLRVAGGRSWYWDGDEWYTFNEVESDPMKNVPTMSYEQVMSIGREARKTEAMMPTWGDVESAFGERAAETGEVNLDERTRDGKRNRRRMLDMLTPVWRRQAALAGVGA